MNIFVDFHHTALYYSLYLLLEQRLGHTLWRPVGLDWHKEGYFKQIDLCTNDSQREEKLAEYLLPNTPIPYSPSDCNSEIQSITPQGNLLFPSGGVPVYQRALTFEQFKNNKIDLIIASFLWNIEPFTELSRKYQNNIPVIVHVGNEWDLNQFQDYHVMASVKPQPYKSKSIVFYKQEFDLDIFSYNYTPDSDMICSFVHNLSGSDRRDCIEFSNYLNVKLYGKYNPDGCITNVRDISNIMRNCKFGLHLKQQEDAYGHVIHNWFACGKPVIYRGSQYKNRLAGKMLQHMVTGIDLDLISLDKCVEIIKSISVEEYKTMCDNVISVFNKEVDFNKKIGEGT